MPKLSKSIEDQLFRENPEMRAKGLRPEVVWVTDTEAPGFRDDLERQIEAIRNSPGEKEVLDWIEKVGDWPRD
jgi:hypothetical protein